MITEDTVMELFAEDNPIPSVDDLDLSHLGSLAYLATLEQRSSEVTQLDTKQTEPTSPKRSMMPWLIAAGVAAVIGVAVIIASLNGEQAPVVDEPTPTTLADQETVDPRVEEGFSVALAFAEAQAGLDVQGLLAVGDGSNSLWGVLSAGETTYPLESDFREAVGWVESVQDCAVSSTNAIGVNVTCTIVTDTSFGQALEVAPLTDQARYTIRYEGETHVGQTMDKTRVVDRIHQMDDRGRFDTEAWAPFVAWIEATHPEDVDVMFDAFTADDFWYLGSGVPALTPESIELWHQHTSEFVAAQQD